MASGTGIGTSLNYTITFPEACTGGSSKFSVFVMTGKVEKTILKGHKDGVSSLCFDERRSCLISAATDFTLRLWDIRVRNAAIRLFKVPQNEDDVNICHTIGHQLVTSRGSALFGYDMRMSDSIIVSTPSFSYFSKSQDAEFNDFGFSSDERHIAVPTDEGDIEIVSATDFQPLHTIKSVHSNIASVARYMPNDNNLVSTGYDCNIANLKVNEAYKIDKRIAIGSLLPVFEDDEDQPQSTQTVNPPFGTSMEVSRDTISPHIALGAGDGSVLILPSRKGKPDFRSIAWGGANVHSVAVCGLSWSTSNSSVWSVGNDSVLINMDPERISVRYSIGWKPNSVVALGENKVAIAGLNTDIEVLEFF